MEEKKYNIIRNLFYSSLSVMTTLFLFVLMFLMGRHLGAEKYGVFMLGLHIATIFEMFTDFGLRDISVRNVAQKKELTEKYIGNIVAWKMILSAVVFVVMIGVVHILGYDFETRLVVYILAPSAFLKSMKYTMRIFFQVHDRFGWDTLLVFVERACLLGVGLAVLFYWKAVLPIAVCFTSVRLVDFLLTLAVLRWKIAPIKPRLDFQFMKKLQIEAFPLGLFFVILTIYSYIDTVMLSLMRTMEDVGLYNSAFKIYEGITILPTVFWLVILPRLSELFTTNQSHHQRLAVRSVKYMFVIGIPTMIFGIILSRFFIGFFYGADYLPAVLALQILFVGIVFQYSNWMLNATLISMSRQKVILALGSIGLISKIILNVILISMYGFNGSATATALGEFLIFGCAFGYLYRRFQGIPVFPVIIKPMIAGGCSALAFHLLQGYPWVFVLFAVGLVYVGGLFLLRTFDRHELQVFIENTFSAKRRMVS